MAQEGKDEKGRFTRGNLFSIGNNGGAPPMYTDPEVMSQKIAEYLDFEDYMKGQGKSKGIYTIEGCALYLGFASRQSMHDYEQRTPEFSYVINRFKLFMGHWNAQKLYWSGSFPGAKFWLMNWGGYKEEATQHLNQVVTELKPQVINTGVPLSGSENDVK